MHLKTKLVRKLVRKLAEPSCCLCTYSC